MSFTCFRAGDLPSVYRNWAKSKQLNLDCACFNAATEKCHMTACSTKLHPVCHDDNLVVVNENKTWEEALSYCSEMRTLCRNTSEPCYNLLSLNSADYNYVRDRIYRVTTTDEVREWVADLAHWQKKILSQHCLELMKLLERFLPHGAGVRPFQLKQCIPPFVTVYMLHVVQAKSDTPVSHSLAFLYLILKLNYAQFKELVAGFFFNYTF